MTVEELVQELVKLCQEGKAQYEVTAYGVSFDIVKEAHPYKEINLTGDNNR